MRRLWDGLGFILTTLFILTGCATEEHLKPPKPQECYNKPPDEPRFEKPPEYPKKYLMEEAANRNFDLTPPDATMKKNGGMGMGGMRGGAGGGGY
jgi:hypothetical protein